MRIRTLPGFALAITALALVVAACGGGTATTAPTTVPTATKPPAATTGPTAVPATTAPGSTAAPTATPVPPTATPRPTTPPAPTNTAAPVSTGNFRLAIASVAQYQLLPGFATNKTHLDFFYDAMLGRKNTGAPDPNRGFMTSWTFNADNTVITVKTKDGVKWHDGSTATSADMKATMQFYAGPDSLAIASGSTTQAVYLGEVTTPDATTTIVNLKAPDIFILDKLFALNGFGTTSGYFLPASQLISKDLIGNLNKKPDGTGPYKFVSGVPDQKIQMEAVASHFFYGVPKWKTVEFNIIPEGSTRMALLTSGAAEAIESSTKDVATLKSNYDIVTAIDQKTVGLNLADQFATTYGGQPNPLANVRVRQALNMAVDREEINKQFVAGLGKPTATRHDAWDAIAWQARPIPKQDIAGAKKLLADAGYPNGFTMKVWSYLPLPALDNGPDIQEAINVWWEQAGVKVQRQGAIEVVAWYTNFLAKHDFGVAGAAGVTIFVSFGRISGSVGALDQLKTSPFRLHEDADLAAASVAVAKAKNLDEYKLAATKYSDIEYNNWRQFVLYTIGEVWAVKKGVGGDKWNMGRTTYSSSIVTLVGGKDS